MRMFAQDAALHRRVRVDETDHPQKTLDFSTT